MWRIVRYHDTGDSPWEYPLLCDNCNKRKMSYKSTYIKHTQTHQVINICITCMDDLRIRESQPLLIMSCSHGLFIVYDNTMQDDIQNAVQCYNNYRFRLEKL